MANIELTIEQLSKAVQGIEPPLKKLVYDQLTPPPSPGQVPQEPDEQTLWQDLGLAPKREFPNFEKHAPELEKIKETLRAKAASGSFDLTRSGRTERSQGLILATKADKETVKGAQKRAPIDQNLADLITDDLMRGYFEQAKWTEKNPNKPAVETQAEQQQTKIQLRGIPHDCNTEKPEEGHRSKNPNAWLPGLFLIDEIFKALLSTTDEKIRASNLALMKAKSIPDPGLLNKFKTAKDELDRFVLEISEKPSPLKTDAAKYLPFINHHKDPQITGESVTPTYIKLVRVEEFVIGAIVHVGDWAGGSHSSGSAIHP